MFITIQRMKVEEKGKSNQWRIAHTTTKECDEYSKEYDERGSLILKLLKDGCVIRQHLFTEKEKDGDKSKINIYIENNEGKTINCL